jgi:glutamate transport system substrate-binding protein
MRRRALLGAVLAIALLAAACGSDDDPTTPAADDDATEEFAAGSTMARIKERGKMVVGTKFDQPLFGLKNPLNGQIEGFDVEIAKLMAQGIFGGTLEEAAKKVEFIETVSKVREPSITEAKVDIVVATYTINDARKAQVDFAGPYYTAGQDIMVKKSDTAIKSVTDLNGKKVCSVQGSTSITNVQKSAPQADLSISFDSYSKCAEALKDGRVQAVTTDDTILVGLVKDNPNDFRLVGSTFTKEPYGIGLKKGDEAFRTYLNDRIELIVKNGEWAKAWERTVGTAGIPTPPAPTVDRYVATAAPSSTTTSAPSSTTTTAKP